MSRHSTALGLALGLVTAGCGDDPTFNAVILNASVSPAQLDFGPVYVGTEATLQALITVRDGGRLLYEAQIGDPSFMATPPSAVFAPGNPFTLSISFRPLTTGEYSSSVLLNISSGSSTASLSVLLVGEGRSVPDCEDGNGCTVDEFDAELGRCLHRAEPLDCSDFSACTEDDVCVEGICLGSSLDCDDNSVCTDDFCDASEGCLNLPTARCDDGNNCTTDICHPDGSCEQIDVADGTPCDDGEQCKTADICVSGVCEGVAVPDGTSCNDGDPCSTAEACDNGQCLDPNYDYPSPGDLRFQTAVGTLAPGAQENLIISQHETTFVGLEDGMASVSECGELNFALSGHGPPKWNAALALPTSIEVPFGATLKSFDPNDGSELAVLQLDAFLTQTASTATVTTSLHDMAARASGMLVAAVQRSILQDEVLTKQGFLLEIHADRESATVFADLGPELPYRLVIDRDEAVIAAVQTSTSHTRIMRFGPELVPSGTWAIDPLPFRGGELALGPSGEIYWSTAGVRFSRDGIAESLLPTRSERRSVVASNDAVFFVTTSSTDMSRVISSFSHTSTLPFTVQDLTGEELHSLPALTASEHLFTLSASGAVSRTSTLGNSDIFTSLPFEGPQRDPIALSIAPSGLIVVVADGQVFGIDSVERLNLGSWPRFRKDNFSTGHR